MKTQKFRWRVFVSFGLTLTFLFMLVSGIVLFIAPPGRVANWTGWNIFGLTRSGWHEQHVIFAFAFALLSLLHLLLFNWKTFLAYLKKRAERGLQSGWELASVVALGAFLAIGTGFHIQPFAGIVDLGHRLSGSWEKPGGRPPVPHAETLSLDELSRLPQVGASADKLVERLRSAGMKVSGPEQTLLQIADANDTDVRRLYTVMTSDKRPGTRLSEPAWANRTLLEAADEAGVSSMALQMALKQQGIDARPDERLSDIAAHNRIQLSVLLDQIESITEKR